MKIYRCYFEFRQHNSVVDSEKGLAVFRDGFWLSEDGKLAVENCLPCKYWIPPHKIIYIEVVKET